MLHIRRETMQMFTLKIFCALFKTHKTKWQHTDKKKVLFIDKTLDMKPECIKKESHLCHQTALDKRTKTRGNNTVWQTWNVIWNKKLKSSPQKNLIDSIKKNKRREKATFPRKNSFICKVKECFEFEKKKLPLINRRSLE